MQSLCGEDHIVKGVSVHISNAAPKTDPHRTGTGLGGLGGGPPGGGPAYPGGGRGGGGHRDKGHSSFGQPSPYGQPGGGMGMAAGGGGAGWNPPGAGGRASMEMPNIQALGLSSSQGGQQSGSNPMAGMAAGLNIGALPMNPALVAAALNQAGWGLIGNLGGGGGPGGAAGAEHGAFPTPTSFSTPGNVTTTQVGPGHTTMTNAAPGNAAAAAAAATGGILANWGAAAAAGGSEGGMPAATPPTVTPQHHPTTGSWPSQTRDKHGGAGGGGGSGGWKTYGSGDVWNETTLSLVLASLSVQFKTTF